MNRSQIQRLAAALEIEDDDKLYSFVFRPNGLDWFVFSGCCAWCNLMEEMCRLLPHELRMFLEFVLHAERSSQ